jgi:hypothetical protein
MACYGDNFAFYFYVQAYASDWSSEFPTDLLLTSQFAHAHYKPAQTIIL